MVWRFDRFLYQKEKPFWTRVLLFPLCLLSLPYGWAVRLRGSAYAIGLFKGRRLSCPVVSVGNITVGGTGKTPLVMALARRLLEKGVPVGILSRGYKGRKVSGSVVSDGWRILLGPQESGDEPHLMARNLRGVPILVGKDRFQTGQMALKQFAVEGLLLDDGYQHLKLHRDLDILLIDSGIGFGDRHLLPRGIMREPVANLRRAQMFVLTKVEDPEGCRPLEAELREIHPGAEIYHSHFEPAGLIGPNGEWEEVEGLKGKKVFALSGVANPGYFTSLLRKCGLEIAGEQIFPDHHSYRAEDLTSLQETVNKLDYLVTTEKDMVKLGSFETSRLLPLRALRIEVKIWEEAAFYEHIMKLWRRGSRKVS
jgi:tetraacyldisaccharide 4'-kinase